MMKAITTTLNAIRKHQPCEDGWQKLLAGLGKTKADGKPLKFSEILKHNGLDDALWCLRSLPAKHHRTIRLLAADYAERVLHLYERQYPADKRPRLAIKAARDFANGKITRKELTAAWAAARDAWEAAWAAAWDAGDAAGDAERKIQAKLLIKYFG